MKKEDAMDPQFLQKDEVQLQRPQFFRHRIIQEQQFIDKD